MGDSPEQPADPIMAPIESQRRRVESDGPLSKPADHLAHAQRAYLYALHSASGALVVSIPLSALVITIALFITRSLNTPRGLLLGAFSISVLVWLVWVRALRILIAADPAYRISTPLFLARKSIMPAALIAAFSVGVLLASSFSSSPGAIAPESIMLALAGAGFAWIALLTAWRTRSLLSRCDEKRHAVWSDIGALVLLIAALVAISISSMTNALLYWAVCLIAVLGAVACVLALLRLRSRIGGIMRDMERAEPGPVFEPVGPGS